MRVTMIVAVNKKGYIGLDNKLPWRCPGDLSHFQKVTNGKCLLMGSKTFNNLPKRGLPNRFVFVLSNKKVSGTRSSRGLYRYLKYPKVDVFAESIFSHVPCKFKGLYSERELIVAGGAEIYRLALDEGIVDEILYSEIDDDTEGDTKFLTVEELMNEWGYTKLRTEARNGFILNTITR